MAQKDAFQPLYDSSKTEAANERNLYGLPLDGAHSGAMFY
eukprot:COSAG06_NODE_57921_length_278_cov_2.122905_1_plen_39_part_01